MSDPEDYVREKELLDVVYGLEAEVGRLRARVTKLDAEAERLREALERIGQWSWAYPLSVFPKPDLARARSLLEAGGMTLDSVSADAMRHVVEGVGAIARAVLAGEGTDDE